MSSKAIVLDANILIRAVLGKRVRELNFQSRLISSLVSICNSTLTVIPSTCAVTFYRPPRRTVIRSSFSEPD